MSLFPIAEILILRVCVHRYRLCGGYVGFDELEKVRTKWFPKRVKRPLSRAGSSVSPSLVGELKDWLERYERIFYETAALALLGHVTRQRQLMKLTSRFNPLPAMRMLPKTFDRLHADLATWLDAVAHDVSKVGVGRLTPGEPTPGRPRPL
ncbi:MAG: hypothetical protein DRK00_05865 [Thermoprotei archaeon]|nr:MAG: hypothetical protein DRK00_05865 [Thermoprotei archaeon]